VANESLGQRIKQYEIDEGEREGLSTDEREELGKRCRENRTFKVLPKKPQWVQPVSVKRSFRSSKTYLLRRVSGCP